MRMDELIDEFLRADGYGDHQKEVFEKKKNIIKLYIESKESVYSFWNKHREYIFDTDMLLDFELFRITENRERKLDGHIIRSLMRSRNKVDLTKLERDMVYAAQEDESYTNFYSEKNSELEKELSNISGIDFYFVPMKNEGCSRSFYRISW